MITGSLEAIAISTARRAPMTLVTNVLAIAGRGLAGDRYTEGGGSYNESRPGYRQVTLFNKRVLDGSGFEFRHTRRNLLVSGIELNYLIGKAFTIGDALLKGVKYCDPCLVPSVMANTSLRFKDVFHERGGIIADIIEGAVIAIGDVVTSPQTDYDA